MANEAVLRVNEQSGSGQIVHPFTVADGTAITRGALLKLTDPNTASIADGDADVLAGIAASDKVANDGQTQIGVHKKGIFDMVASGSIAIGAPVVSHAASGGANIVAADTVSANSGSVILGYALEAASEGETFRVRVNL